MKKLLCGIVGLVGLGATRSNNNGTGATLAGAPNTRLNQWFNTSVFSQLAAFTYGAAPRNVMNHVRFGNPGFHFGPANFGVISAAGTVRVRSNWPPSFSSKTRDRRAVSR